LSATNGLLTLGTTNGLDFTVGDGTFNDTMTFIGTLSEINGALEGLTFTPLHNFAGSASISIVTNDRGHVGIGGAQSATSNVDIVVSPVNDAPLVTGTPGGITFTENGAPATIDSGITIVDVDDTHLESAT